MSAELLLNICDANKNPLQILGIIKLRVDLNHTRLALKSISCDSLAASAIIEALVELDSGDCIPTIWKPK